MYISTDSYFTNAKKPEKACQDYAINGHYRFHPGVDEILMVILSDGCSSSRHVDIGARLLTHVSKNHYLRNNNTLLPSKIIRDVCEWCVQLDLPSEAIDATLIFMVPRMEAGEIDVYMFGDGNIIVLGNNSTDTIYSVEFAGNFPYYLSYLVDIRAREIYEVCTQGKSTKITTATIIERLPGCEKETSFTHINKHDDFKPFTFNINDIDGIIVATDGMQSFYNFETNQKISSIEVAREMMNIKTSKGEFIKRRITKMLKDFAKQEIYNTDDLAVGGFLINERN